MKFMYTANVKGKQIQEKTVPKLVASINAELGVPVLTKNMVYNYFSNSRPERTSAMVQNLQMERNQLFYVV